MTFTYIEHKRGMSVMIERIDENGDSCWIPTDESNSDYRAYLEWLAEGNSPNAPAD